VGNTVRTPNAKDNVVEPYAIAVKDHVMIHFLIPDLVHLLAMNLTRREETTHESPSQGRPKHLGPLHGSFL
jgi:hypothetical protein